MNKPVILLVDDDSAVLEALEASLGPEWREVARIEAFNDPTEVVAAIKRWEKESRLIAVAVVDQMMPGMTGIELLHVLHESPQSAHMRAILLTGYAGLESALAAKNELAVDRYIEKPWAVDSLASEIHLMFDRFLETSGEDEHFVFRELREAGEIEAHLRLRYRVFSQSPHLSRVLPRTETELDVDEYDRVSHLMGLFHRGRGKNDLVGTHRYVVGVPTVSKEALEEIARHCPELSERVRTSKESPPLPMMKYMPHREELGNLVRGALDRGEKTAEASRLALGPEARAGGRRLPQHIVESGMAYAVEFGVEHIVTAVLTRHAAFYRRYGFVEAEGTRACRCDLGVDFVSLHATRSRLPAVVQARVRSLTRRLERIEETCFCRVFPACLPGPYQTGDFTGVDVMCPLRATELLYGSDERGRQATGWFGVAPSGQTSRWEQSPTD